MNLIYLKKMFLSFKFYLPATLPPMTTYFTFFSLFLCRQKAYFCGSPSYCERATRVKVPSFLGRERNIKNKTPQTFLTFKLISDKGLYRIIVYYYWQLAANQDSLPRFNCFESEMDSEKQEEIMPGMIFKIFQRQALLNLNWRG